MDEQKETERLKNLKTETHFNISRILKRLQDEDKLDK